MKYMLNIYGDMSEYEDLTPEQNAEVMQAYDAFWQEASKSGVILAGEALEGPDTATAVQVRGGERLVTDGPFAETKDLIDGFALVEVRSRDEAIQLASEFMQLAGDGTGEILQVFDQGGPPPR